MNLKVVSVCLLAAVAVCFAENKVIGKIFNCPGHNSYKTGIDAHASWTPYAFKPNTEYTINATLTVHTDIKEAIESAIIWIPERKDPIYKFDDRRVNCKESEVFKALEFVNITCPIKRGTHRTVTNMKQFLEGTQAAITGNFIVEAYLKDTRGKELACLRSEFSIKN